MIVRRFSILLLAAPLFVAACEKKATEIRVGYVPELSHAPAMVGFTRGDFTNELGLPVRPMLFPTTPDAVEALLKGDLDFAYAGVATAIGAIARTKGLVTVISGVASGGPALVVAKDGGIESVGELRDAPVATPHLGDAQDVTARAFFGELGFVSREHGGNFQILPVASQDMPDIMARNDVWAVWTVEPWVSQVVSDGGRTLVEENVLWKRWSGLKQPPGTVLLVRKSFLERQPELVDRFLAVQAGILEWMAAHGEQARQIVSDSISRLTGRQLSAGVVERAWGRVSFSEEIPVDALNAVAGQAFRLGFLGPEMPDIEKNLDREAVARASELREPDLKQPKI